MSLLADLGLKPADVNLDDVDKRMQSGNVPPEGIHHAVLVDVGPIPNADGRGWKFTFEIMAGAGKGATVEETLWKPKGEDAKKDATVKNRILMFGNRLGLLKKVVGADGKETTAEVAGKAGFPDCLGATVFVEIQHQDREYKDERSGSMKKIKEAKLTFGGLLAADDKKVKDGIAAGKIAVASGAAGAAAVAAAKDKAASNAAAQSKDAYADL